MNAEQTILLTGVFAASSCALVGSFLVLRKMAMMADAISHAILPGLVLAYFLANGPNLVFGVLGASLAGLTTVFLVEGLQRTGRVKSDAAIGIVFPALFALGTFMISRYFANVHLDADAVLFGEIAFAPFDRLIVAGVDYGSQPMIVLGAITVLNLALILFFYKELKVATFDPGLAAAIGFSPVMLHYGLMTAVSMTTVGAFSAVGAILVVALMIVPAATAYLLTDRLALMIGLSVGSGVVSAVSGYYLAVLIDVSISGMMTVTAGALFGLAALFSPSHGLVARAIRRSKLRERFAADLLVMHLSHHRTAAETFDSLAAELNWSPSWLERVVNRSTQEDTIQVESEAVRLTDNGRLAADRIAASLEPAR
ncbi:MAG: metal ABC transporter permease [Chloroflexia bacterium]|jgi:manganese/zinc/iron transport system permease protein|nr:metal ABC transporter permease [Chloroflexia bacterium]